MTLPNDAVYLRRSLLVVAKDGDGLVDNVLLPDGLVESSKGDFTVDADGWELLKAEFAKRGEIVIDFEHASMGGDYAAPSGKAPAAGWIKALRYEEGVGVIASVQWNAEARELIKGEEYKYWSPAIRVDKKDRKAVELVSAGLTNTPAIYDMPALAAKDGPQETDMKKTMDLKPKEGLRHILLAFQEDELPQFPAISADQQMVTRLLDMLNEKGAGLEDGATLAEVLGVAIEMLGKEDGEEPAGDGEAPPAEGEANKALRAELGLDEDGNIMETVKKLKADQAALVLKAGSAENAEARLVELEAAEKTRVEAHHKSLIDDAVKANKINPNDKPAMAAAELYLSTQGEEQFTALMGGLKPYVAPGQTDAGEVTAKDARSKCIALCAKAFGEIKDPACSLQGYVAGELLEQGLTKLTDAEVETLTK